MANAITLNSKKPIHSGPYGNSSVFSDVLAVATTNLTAGDSLLFCEIPAGTAVDRVTIKNTDLDGLTALTAKIGFVPVNGGAAVVGADVAVAATGAWGQTATTTTYDLLPPYRVEVDSYLAIVVGAAAGTATAGTINARIEGECLGLK